MGDPIEILEVSEACDAAAAIVADVICHTCSLPFSQVIEVASRELFDAARMVADVAMHEARSV